MIQVQGKKPTLNITLALFPLQIEAEPQGKPANLFPRLLGGQSDPGILSEGAGESPNWSLPRA